MNSDKAFIIVVVALVTAVIVFIWSIWDFNTEFISAQKDLATVCIKANGSWTIDQNTRYGICISRSAPLVLGR